MKIKPFGGGKKREKEEDSVEEVTKFVLKVLSPENNYVPWL